MGAVRSPQDIEHLRILYERQGRSVVEISAATGVPVKSIRHYARTRDWRRGAASPPGPDELIARMWVALGRRIALVEKDPGATPARDFISLSHALRDLAALSGGRWSETGGPEDQTGGESEAEVLRAELLARLERILAS